MKNLEKYLSLLSDEVDGLLLTSRYSRHYGAEFDIAEGVAIAIIPMNILTPYLERLSNITSQKFEAIKTKIKSKKTADI